MDHLRRREKIERLSPGLIDVVLEVRAHGYTNYALPIHRVSNIPVWNAHILKVNHSQPPTGRDQCHSLGLSSSCE